MNDFLELTQGLVESKDFEEKSEFEVLPKGVYRAQVCNIEKKTSQSGNEYIGMTLEVIDGEYEKRKIFNNLFFTQKTAENTIKRIYKIAELIDVPAETFSTLDDIVEYCKKFMNMSFELEFDDEAFHKVSIKKAL